MVKETTFPGREANGIPMVKATTIPGRQANGIPLCIRIANETSSIEVLAQITMYKTQHQHYCNFL